MNDCELYQRLLCIPEPWFVERVLMDEAAKRIQVGLQHERGRRWACPKCGRLCAVYDHQREQAWRHLDTCDYQTWVFARVPRVRCPEHGVLKVKVAWDSEAGRITPAMESRGIDVMLECDLTSAERLTGLDWDTLWKVMEMAVQRGRDRKEKRIPSFLGVDEKSFAKRHQYETIVFDLEQGTVEFVAEGRKQKSLEGYFQQFEPEELETVEAVAMDMWDPYVAALRAYVPDWEQKLVFDRYHVMGLVNKAVDDVRKQEHREMREQGDESLKGTRYLWLWNEENIPEGRLPEFRELRKRDLKVSRAWAIKENLRHLWNYSKVGWAQRFFRRWYFWATHSRIPAIIKAAKSLKGRIKNVLTFIKHRITNAVAEGLNSKIETIKKMACGYRNREHYRTAIYFHCGGLSLYPQTT